jgi:hypothetical protein
LELIEIKIGQYNESNKGYKDEVISEMAAIQDMYNDDNHEQVTAEVMLLAKKDSFLAGGIF